jgi:hypothetical protein
VCVCMRACVCVRVWVRVWVCVWVRVCVWLCVPVSVCVRVWVRGCRGEYVCACLLHSYMYLRTGTGVCTVQP